MRITSKSIDSITSILKSLYESILTTFRKRVIIIENHRYLLNNSEDLLIIFKNLKLIRIF